MLYIDCELSDKQFQIRYTDNEVVYEFSPNFYRAEINRKKLITGGAICQLILDSIGEHIQSYGIEVIILDNICALGVDMEKSTEAVALMTGLQQFQEEHNVSILLLAHTPKRAPNNPITDNELAGSKVLMNLVDSAFTIGFSQQDSSIRYFKQIKVRNCEMIYDTSNVLVCEIAKEHAFLGFHYLQKEDERQHLKQTGNNNRDEEISLVRQLLKDGYSQRQIAEKLSISVGKANKLVKLVKEIDGQSTDTVQ